MRRIIALALISAFTHSSIPVIATEPVLLVGNSFTAGAFAHIPQRSVFKDRAVGGYNLDQHFRDSETRSSICAGRKFVLMQDFSEPNSSP